MLSKLTKEDQAQLRDTGTPVGRLVKGIAMAMPETQLKAEHLQRLMQIAVSRQLTHEQVTAILTQIARNAPRSTPTADPAFRTGGQVGVGRVPRRSSPGRAPVCSPSSKVTTPDLTVKR